MQHNVREGQLAAEFIGHWDDAHIGDVGMAQEVALKFRRGDLEATDFDQFLKTEVVNMRDFTMGNFVSP